MEPRVVDTPAAPVLVTGGTGTLGTHVVARLRERGRDVRVLSRGNRDHVVTPGVTYVTADLATGAGVQAAVDGTAVIVHCAGSQKGDGEKARHLVEAARRAGTSHLVYISVVGADRIPQRSALDRSMFGYFGSKLAGERAIAESGVPWTTLRATQFFDLLLLVAGAMARIPVIPAPTRMRFQPVDAGEVAERLVELALGTPAGLVPDLGGPRVYELPDLIRSYLRARSLRRLLLPVPVPGAAARAIRAGANLTPDRAVGRRTWEEFLAERLGSGDPAWRGSAA